MQVTGKNLWEKAMDYVKKTGGLEFGDYYFNIPSSPVYKPFSEQLAEASNALAGYSNLANYDPSSASALDVATGSNSGVIQPTVGYSGSSYIEETMYGSAQNSAASSMANTESTATQSYYKPRDYFDISHSSGYQGLAYRDEYGRAFTEYGAYLREDNFFYPAGARISTNGMYYDDGSGWKFAKQIEFVNENGNTEYAKSGMYGMAPGMGIPFGDFLNL